MLNIYLNGVIFCFVLIAAIGVQNLYVIEQGLAKNRIFLVCLLSFLGDCVLFGFGVFGIGAIALKNQNFMLLLGSCGAIFLLLYGTTSLKSAIQGTHFAKIKSAKPQSLKATTLKTLALSLLNPHAYIDTFIIVGGFCATLENTAKSYFYAGAITASFLWFFALGYSSKMLSRFFTNPKIWRVLDSLIACLMFYIAFLIIKFIMQNLGYL